MAPPHDIVTQPSRHVLFARLLQRLANRPDSEHEMGYNRYGVHLVLIASLVIANGADYPGAHELLISWRPALIAYPIVTTLIFAHIIVSPGVSHPRRLFAIAFDIGSLSALASVGNESTALVYPVYLWIIFGNGFRFGLGYLFAATVAAVAGFGIVAATTPFWLDHKTLAGSLLLGLVALPAYVSVLIRRLSDARTQAEEANRAKSLFMASISHELRTPLNAVIGFSNVLAQTRLTPDQRDMAVSIEESGTTLLAQINALLEFSRLEAGKRPINHREFDLFALMARIANMVRVQAGARNVDIRLRIGSSVPRNVVSGARAIEDVLTNLVANAVKFTSKGAVTISVDERGRANGRATLRIAVRDTGIGIAPEAQARIFESFTQADETIIDRFGGTGLGLAITKRLVEALGGSIKVKSTLGEGSTFSFELDVDVASSDDGNVGCRLLVITHDESALSQCDAQVFPAYRTFSVAQALAEPDVMSFVPQAIVLDARESLNVADLDALRERVGRRVPLFLFAGEPRAISNEAIAVFAELDASSFVQIGRIVRSTGAERDRPSEAASPGREAMKGLRILVAEDNRTNQKVIGRLLEQAGIAVTFADDGEQAISNLTRGVFDLAFMDINMPVMNGIEATKLYRFASLGRPRVPIVALTADVRDEARQRCLDAGMDDCLRKPIEQARLFETIARLTQGRATSGYVSVAPDVEQPLSVAQSPIDPEAIADLMSLGGRDFVNEIVDQFVTDSVAILRELGDAVAQGDEAAFRDQAHALRSCAANVGAQRMRRLCLDWRDIDARELAIEGERHVRQLQDELQKVVVELSSLKAA